MSKIRKFKIGKIELDNNMLLAPMAGISDLPGRLLAKEGGAGLVYTEMVSAKGLVYSDKKTPLLLKTDEKERPVSAQIFGGEAFSMGEAAKIVEGLGTDIIDINLGCPVRKIAKAGAGAKLLANEKLVANILETVVKSVKVPVTVKIRIGLLPGQNVAPEIIKIAENSGIMMAAVHARPASQGHSGEPDMEAFAKACENATIPIIGNGGIVDEITAEKYLKIPGCGGIMIGRGAIGNYSIFKRINSYMENGIILPPPSLRQRIEWFKLHAQYSVAHYGEERGFVLMRKVAHYYIKDLPDAAKVRAMFNKIYSVKEFDEVLEVIYKALETVPKRLDCDKQN